jgi:hypothetical protein
MAPKTRVSSPFKRPRQLSKKRTIGSTELIAVIKGAFHKHYKLSTITYHIAYYLAKLEKVLV